MLVMTFQKLKKFSERFDVLIFLKACSSTSIS